MLLVFVSGICVFLVTLLALLQGQDESAAAAVLCPVADSDPAPALQSQISAQLPYTLDQGPPCAQSLVGFKNRAEDYTSQFPG